MGIPVEEGDEVTVEAVDSADVSTVEEENKENPDSEVQALVEIRTKLRFIGNQVGLRNPEMVPTLVGDINDQKDKHPDAKFAFCVHVGTSASENQNVEAWIHGGSCPVTCRCAGGAGSRGGCSKCV